MPTTEPMAKSLRRTGINVIGDVRWGTHLCYFYETKQDLLDTLVPFFEVGLVNNEYCLWLVSPPLAVEEATRALGKAVSELDRHLAEGRIEIHGHAEWYLHNGQCEPERVIHGWREKLNQALTGGFAGMRASGDTAWVQKEQRRVFREYEKELDALGADQRMIVLCTYPLATNPASQICDVARLHQVAVAKQNGTWEILETPELRQAKAEIKRLNEELQRVIARTPKPVPILSFGVAVLSVTAALIIARLLDVHAVTAPVSLLLCALMFSTWYGGLKPGLLAMALSLLAFDYYFVAPINSLAIEIHEMPRFLIFALSALFVVTLSVAQRSASDSLRRARDALEGSVQELRRTNESLQAENAERRRAEEELKQAERHLRLVLDTTPALIHAGRPDGYLDYFNQRWLEYVGESLEHLQGWGWTAVIHPEEVDGMVNAWRARLAKSELFQYEARVRRADGEYRWMLHHKVPLRNEHGKIVKWYGSSIDIDARKKAEEALRESEQRFRRLVDLMPVAVYVCDLSGIIQSYNHRAVELWGREPKPGDTAQRYCGSLRLYSPDGKLVPHGESKMAEALRTGVPARDVEVVMERPDGSRITVLVNIDPLRNADGAVIGALNCFQDITERKRAEDLVRESQQLLHLVVATLPVGVAVTDRAGDIVLANAESKRIWGDTLVSGRERWAQSKGFWHDSGKRIAPPDWPSVRALSEGLTSLNDLIDIETFDGRQKTIQNSSAPIRNAEGLIVGTVIVNEDVTERKRAEEDQARLAAVVESADEAIIATTLAGIVINWNAAAERVYGYSAEEMLGQSAARVMPPDRLHEAERAKVLMDKGEPVPPFETIRIRKDGTRIDALVSVSPIRDATGRVIGASAIVRDISDRKRAEEALKNSYAQLRALSARLQSVREKEAARIAREIHDDLGQKLTGLKMDLQRAERKLEGLESSPVVNSLIDTIVNATELTDKITASVQEIAANLRPEMLDKLGLSAALHYEARRFQERTSVSCETLVPETEPNLSTEVSTALFRIFQECLTNIARHAHAAKAAASLKLDNGWVTLRVQDDGVGITGAEITDPQSLGLLGMKERTALLGGEIVFQRGRPAGTIVNVRLPQRGTPVQPNEPV